jgi:hypothetical protein
MGASTVEDLEVIAESEPMPTTQVIAAPRTLDDLTAKKPEKKATEKKQPEPVSEPVAEVHVEPAPVISEESAQEAYDDYCVEIDATTIRSKLVDLKGYITNDKRLTPEAREHLVSAITKKLH